MTKLHVSKDVDNLEVTFERELPAPAADVWRSWTRAEDLEAWWGPVTWSTTVYALDVRPGGLWHFGMGPEGVPREAFIRAIYTEVNAKLQMQAAILGGPVNFLNEFEMLKKQNVDRPWAAWKKELGMG